MAAAATTMTVISTLPYESALDPAPPVSPLRLLPDPLGVEPSRHARLLGGMLAFVIALAYFLFIYQYWAPAHPGVDQNGYLVGGRMLAATGSTGMKPANDLGFIGAMWVRNDATGVTYPKYPNGLPLLYAVCLWLFGSEAGGLGVRAAFLISPVGATLSVLGTYFLARQFTGIFGALCAMLLLAFSQLTLSLANNPNSHASCLACVIWGAFLLLRFWQTGSIWRGFFGGFLLGYAVTIRYTEGLLGLLIGIAILSMIQYRQWRNWRGILRAFVPVLGWLIPVGYLVIFNLVAMGTPTGYDTTNESKPGSAFTLDHVTQNWEKLIRQVHDTGLFFALPVALLGMLLAFRVSARRAWILWLWLIPGSLLYMSYYWAPDRGVAYLRFFLTLLPPLAVGVGVTIDQIQRLATDRMQRVFLPIGGGLIVATACSLGLYRGLLGIEDGVETGSGLEGQYRQHSNLATLGRIVAQHVPDGSTILAGTNELHYLQFVGNYECFSVDYFSKGFVARLRSMEERVDAENDPMTQQPARRRFLLSKLEGMEDKAINDLQLQVMRDALSQSRRVFIVLNKQAADTLATRLRRAETGLATKLLDRFTEFGKLRPEDPNQPERRQVDMGGGRRRGPAGGGGPPGRGGDRLPQTWHVLEVTSATTTPNAAAAAAATPSAAATSDDSLMQRMRERRAAAEAAEKQRAAPAAQTAVGERTRERREQAATTPTTVPTTAPTTSSSIEDRMRQRRREAARQATTQPTATRPAASTQPTSRVVRSATTRATTQASTTRPTE